MISGIRHPVIKLGPAMLFGLWVIIGCNSDDTDEVGTGGIGAAAGSGNESTGGASTSTGGAQSQTTGGTTATGGAPSSGGTPAVAGNTASGGSATAGAAGKAGAEAGGAPSTGGSVGAPVPGSGVPLTCPDQGDLASWLPSNPANPCTKGCGPDKIGYKECTKVEAGGGGAGGAAGGGAGGAAGSEPAEALCTVPPCAVCGLCIYPDPMLPCYETPNDPEAPLPPECPEGTLKSTVCEPACDGTGTSTLCIHVNPTDETKIEGCVCAERGKWACATYNTEANTWN